MKKILILLVALLTHASWGFAQDYEENNIFVPFDTIIWHKNYRIEIKEVESDKFLKLYNRHKSNSKFSEPIKDMREVEKLLSPHYKIPWKLSYQDSIVDDSGNYQVYDNIWVNYIEKVGEFRILLTEVEGFGGYYPDEYIFYYLSGHSSDAAYNIRTGEGAYNPYYSALNKRGDYILGGLHSGQEDVRATIYKKQGDKGFLTTCFDLSNLLRKFGKLHAYYYHNQFWIGNTLYLRLGQEINYEGKVSYYGSGVCLSIKISEK